ncbi:MAG: AAA family ATPase [Brevinematia bacterium]
MKLKSNEVFEKVKTEVSKLIVGQEETIKLLFLTIIANGHSLIEGVPGLAKTMIVNALARILSLEFNRIQFTPDLMPSDVTGTEIMNLSDEKKGFVFLKGPIFANVLLADEINRTPPKTQSALLQAMQEKKVTILGKTYELPKPFFVFATQNPIEYQGTYPLPEAQLDRFLFKISISYPDHKEEMKILDVNPDNVDKLKPALKQNEILELQEKTREIFVSEKVKSYILDITRNTRPQQTSFSLIKDYVSWGVGPRGSQMLLNASKANALIKEKTYVDKEDVDEVLFPVLNHRIFLSYHANAEGITTEGIISYIKKEVEKLI